MLAAVLHSLSMAKCVCMFIENEFDFFLSIQSACTYFFNFNARLHANAFSCLVDTRVSVHGCSSNPYRKTPCNCRRQRLAHVDVCRALNNKIQFSFFNFFCSVSQLFHQLQRERRETTRERAIILVCPFSVLYYLQLLAKLCFSLLVSSLPLVIPYLFF